MHKKIERNSIHHVVRYRKYTDQCSEYKQKISRRRHAILPRIDSQGKKSPNFVFDEIDESLDSWNVKVYDSSICKNTKPGENQIQAGDLLIDMLSVTKKV